MSCCDCSTTEGEPELCTLTHTSHCSNTVLLHWCHDEGSHHGTVSCGIPWMEWISTHPTKKGSTQQVSRNHPGRRTEYTSKCSLPPLPSKCLYHSEHINCIAHAGHCSKHNK